MAKQVDSPKSSKKNQPEKIVEEPFIPISTLSNSMKDRYIVRSQHQQVGSLRFYPPNKLNARESLMNDAEYALGDTMIMNESRMKEMSKLSSYQNSETAVRHTRPFKATSPVTQCIL